MSSATIRDRLIHRRKLRAAMGLVFNKLKPMSTTSHTTAPVLAPRDTPGVIDYSAFPHIVEDIISYSSVDTLMNWRATCKILYHHLNPQLFTSLSVTGADHNPKPNRLQLKTGGELLTHVPTRESIFGTSPPPPLGIFKYTWFIDIFANEVSARDLRVLSSAFKMLHRPVPIVRVVNMVHGWEQCPIRADTFVTILPTLGTTGVERELQPPPVPVVIPDQTRKVVLNIFNGRLACLRRYWSWFYHLKTPLEELVFVVHESTLAEVAGITRHDNLMGYSYLGALIGLVMNHPTHRETVHITVVNVKWLQLPVTPLDPSVNDYNLSAEDYLTRAISSYMELLGWDHTVFENVFQRVYLQTDEEYREQVGKARFQLETAKDLIASWERHKPRFKQGVMA